MLQRPGWPVHAVDMVLHELTRNQTPTSEAIAAFVDEQALTVRAYLYFLEERGWIASAEEIERRAIQNGRDFSRIRFP